MDGKEQKIDVSQVDVSMNGIELQDREFVAAIRERREPRASVADVLPCYRWLDRMEQQLAGSVTGASPRPGRPPDRSRGSEGWQQDAGTTGFRARRSSTVTLAQQGLRAERDVLSRSTTRTTATAFRQRRGRRYCRKFGLTPTQREAMASRNVLQLIAAGGNIYYLAKFAGILGLDVQDIGAQQTGMSKDAFKAMLLAAGR